MGLIAIMLGIALLQIPSLIKDEKYKELLAFLGLWLMATVYALLAVLEAPFLINPFEVITDTVTLILK